MDPQPLVGIAAHEVFDDLGELCGIGDDVGLKVASADQLDGGVEAQDVFAELRIPHGETRDYGRVGAQGDTGKSAGRAGWDSEEIDKDALRWGHIGVH